MGTGSDARKVASAWYLMALCPHCKQHQGVRQFRGYCSNVHRKLATRKPQKLRLNCKSCGALVIRNPSAVAPSGNVFCKKCGKNSGENHHAWKEGQYIGPDGYRMVLKDGRYQREHRVVWEEVNHSCLLPFGTIHHINHTKSDNSPDNLLLLSDQEHGRLHRLLDGERVHEAASLLRSAGNRQHYYPLGIDRFISLLNENAAEGRVRKQ